MRSSPVDDDAKSSLHERAKRCSLARRQLPRLGEQRLGNLHRRLAHIYTVPQARTYSNHHSIAFRAVSMRDRLRPAALYARTARRLAVAPGVPLRKRVGALDDRLVFVFGSPRSGTTFTAGAIGGVPGFVDLSEVAALKAEIPVLVSQPAAHAARRIRRILDTTRRVGLVPGIRGVEQTPEDAYVLDAIALAYPDARFVHVVRDGRDVVCSLLERGWLSERRDGADDAGLAYGPHARFWVEPGREQEFRAASDARRAAWAWRRYVTTALGGLAGRPNALEIRYERLAADPKGVARELAAFLDAPAGPLAATLGAVHARSVGRYREQLTPDQLADVEDEAGELLRDLGYPAT